MELISVIVPVYKVESYLDRCVQSIVDQTYQNLEIILVDDGSPDNCPAMCDQWAEKDSRIKVLHKTNGGLSDARNAGMAIASGELMGFIDSDDWIEPNMYELLYQHMQHNQADISACGVEMVWEDATPCRMLTASGSYVLSQEEAMKAIILEDLLKQPVWYKLYKSDLIRNIPFAVGKYHEDVFWSYQAIGAAKRICVFDTPCYHYVQRTGSIMGEGYSIKRLDGIEAKCLRQDFLNQYYPEISDIGLQNLYFSCIYNGQQALHYLNKKDADQVFEILTNFLSAYPLNRGPLKKQKTSHRIWLQIANKSLVSVCLIRNYLKIGV